MAIFALILSALALVVAVAAYRRVGGAEIRRRLDEWKAREGEGVEKARTAARERMTAAQARVQSLGERFEQFRARAGDELRARLDRTKSDLLRAADEIRRQVATLRDATASGVETAQRAVEALVARQEARLQCFAARVATSRALSHARDGRFERAGEELEEGLERLEDAESRLREAGTSLESVDGTRSRLREALTAVRREADDWQMRIEAAQDEAEELLRSFEEEARSVPGAALPASPRERSPR